MLVGITGGIGSGKTTICKQLETLGFPVYYSDIEAKRIIQENPSVQQSITDLLGTQAYTDGVYQTSYVASRVFAEPALLAQLNQIVHPAVQSDLISWAKKHQCCFVESALLFESHLNLLCDATIAILASQELRLQRTLQRDYANQPNAISLVQKRMQQQLSDEQLTRLSSYTLLNDGSTTIEQLVQQILQFIGQP